MDWRGRWRQGNWAVEFGWRPHWIEVAGDICWRRPRPTESYRADDDDDGDGGGGDDGGDDDGDTIRTDIELIRGSIRACKATNQGHKYIHKTNALIKSFICPN